MSSTRSNKIVTITNDEAWDLATHLARMADSANVIIDVASQAEADALPNKVAGKTAVRRLDIGVTAVDVWTGSAWFGARVPFGHMGKTDGFQAITSLTTVAFSATQKLQGGMTFDNTNDTLIVPVAGQYRLAVQFYSSGAGTGGQHAIVFVNAANTGITTRHWKGDGTDAGSSCSGVYTLAANDAVSLRAQMNCNTWGTSGYDGTFLEVEYLWPV